VDIAIEFLPGGNGRVLLDVAVEDMLQGKGAREIFNEADGFFFPYIAEGMLRALPHLAHAGQGELVEMAVAESFDKAPDFAIAGPLAPFIIGRPAVRVCAIEQFPFAILKGHFHKRRI
jgi:hypothetical protein